MIKNESTTITQKIRNVGHHVSMLQCWQLSWIFIEKNHVMQLLGSVSCRELWAAQTQWNWGSLLNKTDKIKPNSYFRPDSFSFLIQTLTNSY